MSADGTCDMGRCPRVAQWRANRLMWCRRHAAGVWWRMHRAQRQWIRAGRPVDFPVVIRTGRLVLDADITKCVIDGWGFDCNYMTVQITVDDLFWTLVNRYPQLVEHNT